MGLFRRSETVAGDGDRGVPCAAKVVMVKDGGTRGDLGPVLFLHLLVSLPGEVPFPTSVAQTLSPSLVVRAKPGVRVPVLVDPATRAVTIDWGQM